MNTDKPLRDCHKCCICKDAAGFMPVWDHWILKEYDIKGKVEQPLMCKRCQRAFANMRGRTSTQENATHEMLAWAARVSRKAEHKRMAYKVQELELKLRIEIATTDGLIRKYGKTTTEIGDMNVK
jgi:hypothetical protein